MATPLYTTDVLRLAASLSDPHLLEHEDGRADVRSQTCGSRILLSVQLDKDRRVERLSMQVSACAFGQASAALVEQYSPGCTHQEISAAMLGLSHWLSTDSQPPDLWPGIAALEPARSRTARHGAILLPFKALLAAIEAAT